ncbi:hypothetical protein JCM19233_2010 [Vibrio astriarenae]|nr:hypothetical protein JCM19233_2010 [Vibrio sp. C7]
MSHENIVNELKRFYLVCGWNQPATHSNSVHKYLSKHHAKK